MRGGVEIYRGSPVPARNYLESDRSRADDYYLAEGAGVAARYVATPSTLVAEAAMDGDTYERWVAGYDVETGAAKGRLVIHLGDRPRTRPARTHLGCDR